MQSYRFLFLQLFKFQLGRLALLLSSGSERAQALDLLIHLRDPLCELVLVVAQAVHLPAKLIERGRHGR